AAIFVPFLFVKNRALLADVSSRIGDFPVSRRVLGAHLAAIAIFGALSFCLFGSSSGGWRADALASLWLVAGISAILLGSWALIPSVVWKRIAFQTGHIWIYALPAFVYACVVGGSGRLLWEPTRRLTFALVHAVLKPVLPGVFADPVTRFIGTSRFYVRLQPECSGLEGIGLILAFTGGWLALFRKECRFPNALALLPIGVALMFLLNIARISALILIGSAGASRAALEGFHSQAGWIVFNIVALVFAASARRIPWLRRDAAPASVANPVAPYLMPLLAILAVGMLSAAVSAGFEWLYPFRFFAAAAMLWHFRKRYAGLVWRFTWAGPAIGALVFVLWVALDRLLGHAAQAAPAALLAATPLARYTWLTFRILAAVTTVAIAEELAFRGFLLRRLISDDFESVSLRSFTWVSFVVSSALFGFLHGDRWLAGTLAGFCYAGAVMRRGRLVDGIVAHATTNALLATSVFALGKWQYW
ncbi:MAG TPA: exosortase E/protease, VPEID-CTERM system, partial [Bryobacteraceae bacterium]|nr:exosortase E/protease, VPEID-CTERM system [Bryobacteraceae bacterium]